MALKIFPSVMAKDQKELNLILKKLEGVAKQLHLDFLDGKFADNQSLNFDFRLSKKFNYNAHLMIKKPEQWIEKYGKKVDLIITQVEEISSIKKYIELMEKKKMKVGFALKPETKIDLIKPLLSKIDTVLILTVNPGFYGSKYLKVPLKKIMQIKKINPKINIIVDGHMNPDTISDAVRAGADYFVSGSFVTKSNNPKQAVKELEKIVRSEKKN